jgi:hypothetical protein
VLGVQRDILTIMVSGEPFMGKALNCWVNVRSLVFWNECELNHAWALFFAGETIFLWSCCMPHNVLTLVATMCCYGEVYSYDRVAYA